MHASEQVVEVLGRCDPGPDAEVQRPRQVKALDDAIVLGHKIDERVAVVVILLPDIDRRFHRAAERSMIHARLEAGDDAPLHQSLHPRSGRVRAQPHLPAELALRQSTIASQGTENIAVQIINHSAFHCTGLPRGHKTGPYTDESLPESPYSKYRKDHVMTLSAAQHRSIDQLLRTWRSHDDLKRQGADLPELFRSHRNLADARQDVRSVR